jgi:uncharacterized membrane protein YbhN (UPF0104 family)
MRMRLLGIGLILLLFMCIYTGIRIGIDVDILVGMRGRHWKNTSCTFRSIFIATATGTATGADGTIKSVSSAACTSRCTAVGSYTRTRTSVMICT